MKNDFCPHYVYPSERGVRIFYPIYICKDDFSEELVVKKSLDDFFKIHRACDVDELLDILYEENL